jgi:GWxTD domain-containing protein
MYKQTYHIIIYLLIAFIAGDFSKQSGEKALLEKGYQLEATGEFEEALDVWGTAVEELEHPSIAIGREYIRLTTDHNLRDYYETASSMYNWGLSGRDVEPNREALEKEIEMLEPLLSSLAFDNEQVNRWKDMLEKGDSDIYDQIRVFWEQLDPTPGTRYNERLIEHWERIAYAREHFDRKDDPPFGTDDRGSVYVQYGEPDKKDSGFLNITSADIYTNCPPGCNREVMVNVIPALDPNPYYEIWVYEKPNSAMKFNLVKIFGDKAIGGFSEVEKVEDFIPSKAFSLNDNRYAFQSLTGLKSTPGVGATPGMVMQFNYYLKLSSTDFFFANRYEQLYFEWVMGSGANKGKHQGPIQEERSRIITLNNIKEAPPEQSTYAKALPSIDLSAHHYRILDEQNRPAAFTFLESQPGAPFLDDLIANQDILFPGDSVPDQAVINEYKLLHGVKVNGEDGELLSQSREQANLVLDLDGKTPSSSVFKVPFLEENQKLTLFAELHNENSETKPALEDSPFPASLRGIGKLESELPKPLNSDPQKLQMSDLILGYQMNTEAQNVLFPFVVANDQKIPQGEELAVHFQIYHLQEGENGLANFTIDYEITQDRRMQWLLGRDREVSLSFTQQVRGSRYVQNLSILTRELEPGTYTFSFEVTDENSGKNIQKEIELEIVASKKQNLSSL